MLPHTQQNEYVNHLLCVECCTRQYGGVKDGKGREKTEKEKCVLRSRLSTTYDPSEIILSMLKKLLIEVEFLRARREGNNPCSVFQSRGLDEDESRRCKHGSQQSMSVMSHS